MFCNNTRHHYGFVFLFGNFEMRLPQPKDDMSEEEDLWKWLLDLSRVPAEVPMIFSWDVTWIFGHHQREHHDWGIYAEAASFFCGVTFGTSMSCLVFGGWVNHGKSYGKSEKIMDQRVFLNNNLRCFFHPQMVISFSDMWIEPWIFLSMFLQRLVLEFCVSIR